MLTYAPARSEQYHFFLQMMWDDGQDYLDNTMRGMQMTWEEYAQIFRILGEMQAIYRDDKLAGLYWIEERDNVLPLHGLILKYDFQKQGIGTAVLTMLAEKYTRKMEKIDLGVYQANTGAISLYEKLGYIITRTLDELHFYIMQKPLSQKAEA